MKRTVLKTGRPGTKILATVLVILMIAATAIVPYAIDTYPNVVAINTGPSETWHRTENIQITSQLGGVPPHRFVMGASNNPHDATGFAAVAFFASHTDMSLKQMFATGDARESFSNATGADLTRVKRFTPNDFLGYTLDDLVVFYKKYQVAPASKHSALAVSGAKSTADTYNPVEHVLNFTLQLVLDSVSTSNKPLKDIVDAAKDSVTMVELLTEPVKRTALNVALSAASNKANVSTVPIGELVVSIAENTSPKENGQSYSDPLDVLLYQLNEQEGVVATPDTNVGEFIGRLIQADGEFVPREDDPAIYPSVFWIKGVADPDASFDLSVWFPRYNNLINGTYLKYDDEVIANTGYSINSAPDTGASIIHIPGVFATAGIHTLIVNLCGMASIFYIELTPPVTDPPTSEPPTSEPPTSEPPTSEPPTSEPPTTEPPTSEPPTTDPLGPDVPVIDPILLDCPFLLWLLKLMNAIIKIIESNVF